jgi:hypothetical protein
MEPDRSEREMLSVGPSSEESRRLLDLSQTALFDDSCLVLREQSRTSEGIPSDFLQVIAPNESC